MIPPDDFDPPTGVVQDLEPRLRRIVAPNPSPMTYRGTNTYLLGTRDIAVIDPGPDPITDAGPDADPDGDAHLHAILGSLTAGQRISHVIVTHSHLDHSPLARPLANLCGTPVIAFGDATAGRSKVMSDLAARGLAGGGEGIDHDFAPDICVAHGDHIQGSDWSLQVIHTPGHLGNHISLRWGDACFTADHVMGWASSLVSPPDGDLTDFMASCAALQAHSWRIFYPGHGAPVHDPAGRLDWLVTHRRTREASILAHLAKHPQNATTLAAAIYADAPAMLLSAATRNVLAHLIDLTLKNQVSPQGELHADAVFQRN